MKKRLIQLVIVLTGIFFLYGTQLSIAEESTNPYKKEGLSVDQIIELYHNRVNELFNAKQGLLTKGKEGSGVADAPKDDKCEKNNYSTYCLAKESTQEYVQFQEVLLEKQVNIEFDETDDLFQISTKAITQSDKINNELEIARSSLDVALQSYNELRMAYAMHLQFQTTIKKLYIYNTKLAELRTEIAKIPGKFIDATTAQCK